MDRIMTKTLAEVYIQQGHVEEAYKILKILYQKDSTDLEIQKRLTELSEKLKSASPLSPSSLPTTGEKIRRLERWLTHIQERKNR